MYQSSIRNKKSHLKFNQDRKNNYIIDEDCEEYAYVKKMLGNCRISVISNSGDDSIGVIRGTLRKFNKRVLIETGDIVVVSKREFQNSKVDVVHKYNQDQVQTLIKENKLSNILINFYNNKRTDISNEDNTSDYIEFYEEEAEEESEDDKLNFEFDLSDHEECNDID
jgi:translation initiation factor 1A